MSGEFGEQSHGVERNIEQIKDEFEKTKEVIIIALQEEVLSKIQNENLKGDLKKIIENPVQIAYLNKPNGNYYMSDANREAKPKAEAFMDWKQGVIMNTAKKGATAQENEEKINKKFNHPIYAEIIEEGNTALEQYESYKKTPDYVIDSLVLRNFQIKYVDEIKKLIFLDNELDVLVDKEQERENNLIEDLKVDLEVGKRNSALMEGFIKSYDE